MKPENSLVATLKVLLKRSVLLKVAGFVTLLFLSACHLPTLEGIHAGPETPTDYNGIASDQNSAQIGIEEFFADPILTQLITQALSQNQELKIRNQEIRRANFEILARRGAYLPFVSLGAEGGFEKPSLYTPLGAAEEQLTYPDDNEFPDPLPNLKLAANLFWRVDIWREFRNERDAAAQRYFKAIEERNFLITQIVAEIAENYYDLAALDKQLEFLNETIEIQKKSLEVAKAQKAAARGTELPVQRFLAEVRKNESQKLIVRQRIIEVENRINFLAGRFPQAVERQAWDLIKLDSQMLQAGVPAQLLQNRRDIVAAEHEVEASGLNVLAARARFFPRLDISAAVGFEAFNPRYLFEPEAFIANAAGDLVAPLINRKAIRADYLGANARQLQAIYNYQRTILKAFTEVVNQMAKAENLRQSLVIKQEQIKALEKSVDVASGLFQGARGEYVDVLFSQRDLLEARTALIETKQDQFTAIVRAYQALGGGNLLSNAGNLCADLFYIPTEVHIDNVKAPSDSSASPTPAEQSNEKPTATLNPKSQVKIEGVKAAPTETKND